MNRRTLTLSGVVCGVLLVAWFMLLWSPKGSQLADAKEREAAAETEAQELEAKLARLQEGLQNSPQLQADLDRVRSAVPVTADLPQFILDADDAASRAGVEFLSITPSEPEPGVTTPTQVKLALTAKGEYQPLLAFLDELLRMRRLVLLDGITITTDEETGALNAALDARMFTTAPPPLPVGATAPTATPTETTPTTTPEES